MSTKNNTNISMALKVLNFALFYPVVEAVVMLYIRSCEVAAKHVSEFWHYILVLLNTPPFIVFRVCIVRADNFF